jgi:putative sporulation protein YtxC
VLKSLCIKTNNSNIVNYLLNELDSICLDKVFVSKLKFKVYTNVIIHYKGNNLEAFFNSISNIISSAILKFYEPNIIKRIISLNYFYFTDIEQAKIYDICKSNLSSLISDDGPICNKIIVLSLINYFLFNKSLILDGFVDFRLQKYIDILDETVDTSVNKFVVDREYVEFIELLQTYVNSKEPSLNVVHLIYNNQESILLDEFRDIIDLKDNVLDTKYISDISFSSNDYTLNALLTLLPKKIYIHLINSVEDEFINTLKLIFDDKIFICTDCDICKIYKLEKLQK